MPCVMMRLPFNMMLPFNILAKAEKVSPTTSYSGPTSSRFIHQHRSSEHEPPLLPQKSSPQSVSLSPPPTEVNDQFNHDNEDEEEEEEQHTDDDEEYDYRALENFLHTYYNPKPVVKTSRSEFYLLTP
jgi:hypothetical protein